MKVIVWYYSLCESSGKPRVGSLVLLVHDFADHWLELAKMARYVQYQVITITEEERGVLRNVAQNQC